MTRCVEDFQLPPGQLWWHLRFLDGDRVSETLFTYEDYRKQTWYYARRYADTLLTEMGLNPAYSRVALYEALR